MITSLGIIMLLGMLAHTVFSKLRLPGLLGMLLLGILIGPYGLNWLDPMIMEVAGDLRRLALIVILLRAGLGISKDKLSSVGGAAVRLGFLPGIFEGFAVAFISTKLLGFSFIEGGILGFIIAAVSPAVVVPLMLQFSHDKLGTGKNIPTLILAGASLDDIFAITIFSTFLGLYSGNHVNIGIQLAGIPISIILGIILGAVIGYALVFIFKKYHIRDTKKVMFIMGVAILLTSLEDMLEGTVEIAALLGVMTIGFIILELRPKTAHRLSAKFNKIWVLAEIILFVLVGAEVNTTLALNAGLAGLGIIAFGLIARSIGTYLSVLGTNLNMKERLFCVISYTPKATVQAAIGAVPLSYGVKSGELILAMAVLSIVITAPLGAIAMQYASTRLLEKEE